MSVVAPAAGCDCATCDFYTGNPDAVEPVCSGSNADCGYCGCARTNATALRVVAAPCGECSIRCGSRTDITDWMHDIGGTVEFDDIEITSSIPPRLPRFIPVIDQKDISELDRSLNWGAYGLNLRRVFSPRTARILPGWVDKTAREGLGLGPDQLSVLVGYGEDPLVEAFWTRRRDVIPQIAEQEWDLVLAPNYSMYGTYPRAEMLMNFRRNLVIAADMIEAGINAVPNLYWFRLEDLTRYRTWITDTQPRAVAVNVQTFRRQNSWEQTLLPGLIWLANTIPETTSIIITGASRADRIGQLNTMFNRRWHLLGTNALLYARRGAVMTDQGRQDVHARTPDAFAASVRHYSSLLENP